MNRLRAAGWLLVLPAWFTASGLLVDLDLRPISDASVRSVFETRFGFWTDADGTLRVQLALNLALFAGALIVGVLAIAGRATRAMVATVAGVYALLVLPGVLWNYIEGGPPDALLDWPMPVPGGRLISGAIVVFTVGAVYCALTAATRLSAAPPPGWGGTAAHNADWRLQPTTPWAAPPPSQPPEDPPRA